MWASHFVRNWNKLAISSWLIKEVQVCQNLTLLNTLRPNLVLSYTALKIRCIVIFLKICCIAVKLRTNQFRAKMEGDHHYLRWWSINCSLKCVTILAVDALCITVTVSKPSAIATLRNNFQTSSSCYTVTAF